MSLTVELSASLTLKLSNGMRPAPLPINFSLTYTKNVMHEASVTGAVTNQAVPQGACTAPKFVLIQVKSGTVDFSWDSAGAGEETLTANDDEDKPTTKMFMRSNATAAQLYITTTGPASYLVWMFQ